MYSGKGTSGTWLRPMGQGYELSCSVQLCLGFYLYSICSPVPAHVYWSSFHCSDEVSEAGNIIKKDAMFWLVVLEVQDPESTSGVALI